MVHWRLLVLGAFSLAWVPAATGQVSRATLHLDGSREFMDTGILELEWWTDATHWSYAWRVVPHVTGELIIEIDETDPTHPTATPIAFQFVVAPSEVDLYPHDWPVIGELTARYEAWTVTAPGDVSIDWNDGWVSGFTNLDPRLSSGGTLEGYLIHADAGYQEVEFSYGIDDTVESRLWWWFWRVDGEWVGRFEFDVISDIFQVCDGSVMCYNVHSFGGWRLVPADQDGFDLDPWCSRADLSEPKGLLDLADLLAFLDVFLANDRLANFAPPSTLLDLADVSAFAQEFIAGCP